MKLFQAFGILSLSVAPLALSTGAMAQSASSPTPALSLQQKVDAVLAEIPKGARVGIVVTTLDGREIVALRPDDRFVPASNTKIFTTAAAYTFLPGMNGAASPRGNGVLIGPGARPSVTLIGMGDARMSSAEDCTVDCLATLADAVARQTRVVGDVIGDARLYADERWSLGMAWNNIPSRSGTGLSALSLDGNEVTLTITPGASAGAPVVIEGYPYYRIANRIVTSATAPTKIDYYRMPSSQELLLTGTVALGAEPQLLRFGIDDPAAYAASRLADLLRARGVKVAGQVRSLYRAPDALVAPALATHHNLIPPPLADDVREINKISQNVYAEMLLRRVGAARGDGSVDGGLKAIEAMMTTAGIPRSAYDLSDGSGMSTYNRVSPRATAQLLRWIASQPWGQVWRATLPIAGTDGSLARRFVGTPLQGKLFAKTGTVNQVTALSGYMVSVRGQTLIVSTFVGDIPGDISVTATIDKALAVIAAEN